MDHPFESPVILSLCPGMRGLERGLERAIGPVTVAAYVEIEAFIVYNLVRQMEQGVVDAAPIWTDLKTFDARPFRGKVHGITAGYPCQPFSLAGDRQGTGDPRHLFPHIERIIETARPLWCFFENVDDHLSLGFDTVYKSLRKLGYSVEAGIYSAEEVGAPHERQRLFILAILANSNGERSRHGNNLTRLFGKSFGTSKKLGNATGKQLQRCDRCGQRKAGRPNTKLDNAANDGHQCGTANNTGNDRQHDTDKPGRKTVRCQPCGCNPELANTCSAGHERRQQHSASIETIRQPQPCGPASECSVTRFPAGQGHYQHEWEEPRTVKPGVGCTVNGYNFKEDLLRMYGNGVVEDQAEVAFIDLLGKHFK